MRVPPTKEMLELRKIFEPYFKHGKFIPDTPKEVKEAREKYMVLFKENYEYWEKFWQSE